MPHIIAADIRRGSSKQTRVLSLDIQEKTSDLDAALGKNREFSASENRCTPFPGDANALNRSCSGIKLNAHGCCIQQHLKARAPCELGQTMQNSRFVDPVFKTGGLNV